MDFKDTPISLTSLVREIMEKNQDLKAEDLKKQYPFIDKTASKIDEEEQIDELSKKTLGSYIKKASDDKVKKFNDMQRVTGEKDVADPSSDNFKKHKKHVGKFVNRVLGVNKAIDRLTKEDVYENPEDDQIEEGIKPYVSVAGGEAHVLNSKGKTVKTFSKKTHGPKYLDHANDHLNKNFDSLRKEEVEEIDEMSNDTLNSYKDKARADRKVWIKKRKAAQKGAKGAN